jgi:glycogen(starch) synthase
MLEGLLLSCDREIPTIVTFMTTHKIMYDMGTEFASKQYMESMIRLESASIDMFWYGHAISESIKQNVEKDYGLPKKTFIAPLCVRDLSEKVRRSRSDSKIRVLFVGRIEPRKGIETLLLAAENVLKSNKNVEFRLIGRNPEITGYSVLKDFRIKNMHNERILNNVHFMGEVEENDLLQNYIDCDIFCLPSVYESFGLVLLEAMVFAKPCIASRTGGMKELVIENETGFLVEPGNYIEFAERIITLVSDSELRIKMGEKGRERFIQEYTPTIVTKNLYKEYQISRIINLKIVIIKSTA